MSHYIVRHYLRPLYINRSRAQIELLPTSYLSYPVPFVCDEYLALNPLIVPLQTFLSSHDKGLHREHSS